MSVQALVSPSAFREVLTLFFRVEEGALLIAKFTLWVVFALNFLFVIFILSMSILVVTFPLPYVILMRI